MLSCQQPLHIALAMCLILLIGFKVMAPVFKSINRLIKEVNLAAESDTNKTEKSNDTDHDDKNKEYNTIHLHCADHHFWYTKVTHASKYSIDYQSSYHYKITIPPPEFCL